MKKRILIALLVTLVIGGIFFWFVDLNQIIELLRRADWRILSAAMVALIMAYVLLAIRWRYLLGNQTSLGTAFHAINMSNLVNSLTPIPELALRVLITGQSAGMTVPGATSGMLVERSLEQVMRTLAFLTALLTGYVVAINTGSLIINTALIVGVLVMMVLFLLKAESLIAWLQGQLALHRRLDRPRIKRALSELAIGLKMAGSPRQLTVGWLISFAIWGGMFVFAYLVLIGLNINLPVPQMVAISLLTLAVAPPSAPGMPGLYQATIVGGLSLVAGLNLALMTTFAIMVHILQIIPLLFLGFWGLVSTNLSLKGLFQQKPQPVPVEQDSL